MPIKYYYFDNRLPQAGKAPVMGAPELPTPLPPLPDQNNPVFNFSSQFVENYQQISPTDLATAVPYMVLCAIDTEGQTLVDFNKEFFNRSIDMNNINKQQRYADRPQMSLQNMSIMTDLAAGGGFLSFSQITMSLKLHKPDMITNSKLVSLLMPGMMMRLTYGWQSNNKFLDAKEIVLFNIRNYSIAFNTSGQATLTIEGRTQSENLGNIYCGDLASTAPPTNDQDATNAELDGVVKQSQNLKEFISYVKSQDIQPDSEGKRSTEVIRRFGVLYVSAVDKLTAAVKQKFQAKMTELAGYKESKTLYFNDITRVKKNKARVKAECVTVYDVVATLCGDTLAELEGKIIPTGRDYRIAFGAFNDNLGSFSGTSIANFPIHWQTFKQLLKDDVDAGNPVPSINGMFNLICDEFLSNEDYWRTYLVSAKAEIDVPDVSFYTTTHLDGKKEIVQITVMDANRDVPLTQELLHSSNAQFLSEKEQEQLVVGSTGIPILRFGHANGFVKNIAIEHMDDPTMKAILINRAENTLNQLRQSIPDDVDVPLQQKRALFLPLKGNMDIIGHIDWKPARFFYISSGIFFLDGMYVITKVQHNLDAGGFTTHVEFSMH